MEGHHVNQLQVAMYQDEVRVPIGDWRNARLKNLSAPGMERERGRSTSAPWTEN